RSLYVKLIIVIGDGHFAILEFPLFCFQFYGDHLALHSFPTRRSSDLASDRGPLGNRKGFHSQQRGRHDSLGTAKYSCAEGDSNRSEEHTSELQSPCNLVCRLLLEKKNNKSMGFERSHCDLPIPTDLGC